MNVQGDDAWSELCLTWLYQHRKRVAVAGDTEPNVHLFNGTRGHLGSRAHRRGAWQKAKGCFPAECYAHSEGTCPLGDLHAHGMFWVGVPSLAWSCECFRDKQS